MPTASTVISIFLASPSDVGPDRDVIARTISEWNNKRGRHTATFFDLVRWENSISAGFGSDGQDVINSQVDPYDVLICLFWKRIGSPTPRAISGTVEEYELALERKRSGEPVEIAIFFKSEAFSPTREEVHQLVALQEFKDRCHEDGALSSPYPDFETLKFQMDLLLDRLARDSGTLKIEPPSAARSTLSKDTSEDDDAGLLDVTEEISAASAEAVTILGEHTTDLNSYTEMLDRSTAELVELNSSPISDVAQRKRVINSIAESMSTFASSMEGRNERLEAAQGKMLKNMRAMVRISHDFVGSGEDYDWNSLESFRTSVQSMNVAMSVSNDSMKNLIYSVASSPRTTREYNRARSKFIVNAERYMMIIEKGVDSSYEVLKELDALLRRKPDSSAI